MTEHGIYTNERRIELAVADWLYDSGAGGFDVTWRTEGAALDLVERIPVLLGHELWGCRRHNHAVPGQSGLSAVRRRARRKLRIVPNGIDVAKFAAIPRKHGSPRQPTVLMIGRIVPIKDIRTFIIAISLLKDLVRTY